MLEVTTNTQNAADSAALAAAAAPGCGALTGLTPWPVC
jgi:hypothetical protein